MIYLSEHHLNIVTSILARILPGRTAVIFGSRVTGNARPTSDIDLCIMGEDPLDLATLADLRAAFSESDLPMPVDLIVWANTDPYFKKIISSKNELI